MKGQRCSFFPGNGLRLFMRYAWNLHSPCRVLPLLLFCWGVLCVSMKTWERSWPQLWKCFAGPLHTVGIVVETLRKWVFGWRAETVSLRKNEQKKKKKKRRKWYCLILMKAVLSTPFSSTYALLVKIFSFGADGSQLVGRTLKWRKKKQERVGNKVGTFLKTASKIKQAIK